MESFSYQINYKLTIQKLKMLKIEEKRQQNLKLIEMIKIYLVTKIFKNFIMKLRILIYQVYSYVIKMLLSFVLSMKTLN